MEGLKAARAGNWLWAIVRGATNLCSELSFRGRAREALEANHEALHAVERMGSPHNARHRANMIERWAEAGDWELAVPAADDSSRSERLGDFYNAIIVAFVRAMLRLGLGDLDGAIADQAFASNTLAWPRTPRSCTTRSPSRYTSTPTPAGSTRRASASTSCSASTRPHSVTSVSRWATLPGRRR